MEWKCDDEFQPRISIELSGLIPLRECWMFVPSGAHDDGGDKGYIEG